MAACVLLAFISSCAQCNPASVSEQAMRAEFHKHEQPLTRLVAMAQRARIVYVAVNPEENIAPRDLAPEVVRQCRALLRQAGVRWIEREDDGLAFLARSVNWPISDLWSGFLYVPPGTTPVTAKHFRVKKIQDDWYVYWKT